MTGVPITIIQAIASAPDRRGERIAKSPWASLAGRATAVRRIDERRTLAEYLIIKAQAEGIDRTPPLEALAIARTLLAQAAGYAQGENWDKAHESLELAFAEIKDRWRLVGIEWRGDNVSRPPRRRRQNDRAATGRPASSLSPIAAPPCAAERVGRPRSWHRA